MSTTRAGGSTTRSGGQDAAERPADSEPTSPADNPPASDSAGQFSPAMDPAVKNIQPGGGIVMSLELAWGKVRRWYLRQFRIPLLVLAGLVVWFFRDPPRSVPTELGTVVSPADGELVQIQRVVDPDSGSCVQFGIFLSIFNVHANRASLPGKVIAICYRPGKMLNALGPSRPKRMRIGT